MGDDESVDVVKDVLLVKECSSIADVFVLLF